MRRTGFAVMVAGALAVCGAAPAAADMVAPSGLTCPASSMVMARLELLFGMSRKDAPPVSDEEWRSFVDEEVSPRFPDGLTVLQGYGEWRNGAGLFVKESSRVLMVWYRPEPDSETRIEAIRDAYKARFRQESVMRVDGVSCVSF